MDKQVFYLRNESIRANAIAAIKQQALDDKSPLEVLIQDSKRTKKQNKKMWPLLKDISQQVVWFGHKYDESDWKDLITALVAKMKKQEQRTAPGIGGGVVMFGERTSKMRKAEMIDVIEAAYWFGTEHGVVFSEDSKKEIEWANRWGEQQMRRAS